MNVYETPLKDCLILEPKIWTDSRGFFFEKFNKKKFQSLTGLDINFVQDNIAYSRFGTLRGLHIQRPPFCQAKLVYVLQGKIRDVVVDVRKDSLTYGESFSIDLDDKSRQQLWVPKGFLHGYAVLSETALVGYKCDDFYHQKAEDSVMPLDSFLNIDWGIPESEFIISDKDLNSCGFYSFQPIEL